MEALLEEEHLFIKALAEEISIECFENGVEVDWKHASYFVKSILMNPEFSLIKGGKILKNAKDLILKYGNIFFNRTHAPEVAAIKLQAMFAEEYLNDEKIIDDFNKLLFAYVEPLMHFVVTFKITKPNTDNAILYRKIVLLIGILIGMSDPSKSEEYHELEAAVNSIMSEYEINVFAQLEPDQKREQILKLSQIVTGIRLYNIYRAKSGLHVVNLPEIVTQSIDATEVRFQRFMNKYDKIIQNLTYSMKDYYKWDADGEILVFYENAGNYSGAKEILEVKNLLLLLHQIYIFIEQFKHFLIKHRKDREVTEKEISKCLETINNEINIRAIIPIEIIFPRFYELSLFWNKYQNMITLLSFYNRFMKRMDNIVKGTLDLLKDSIKHNLLSNEKIIGFNGDETGNNDSKKEEVIVEEKEQYELSYDYDYDLIDFNDISNCSVYYPNNEIFKNANLEFNGFCPVFCAESNGVLYRANRSIGIVKFNNKFYGFKDAIAASLFFEDPEWLITKVLDFARKNPTYMDILNVRSLLLKVSIDVLLISVDTENVAYVDEEIQTELHPIESNIDKKYISNIWEWRAKLSHMANIIHYRTHSSQTVNTLFRTSIWSQGGELAEKGVQTMSDVGTVTYGRANFIYGLRGELEKRKFPEAHVMQFTRPLKLGH